MYAIIESGGKQHKIKEGDTIHIEKIDGEVGKTVELDKVLMVIKGDDINLGNPLIKSARAIGEIVEHGRDKKIIVFKHKRRKNYRRKQGHRQEFTSVKITGIKA